MNTTHNSHGKTTLTQRIKAYLSNIIFGVDTVGGRLFDVILAVLIVCSIVLVMLESIVGLQSRFRELFDVLEWVITAVFLAEYLLRIWIVRRPWSYIISAFGLIDLVSILPSFLGLVFAQTSVLLVVRGLRLLRIFRIFKLTRYTNASSLLLRSLKQSRAKIQVFLFTVLMLVIIIGTIMYLVEGPAHGFDSIPKGIYWAIVTLTTVGYGDVSPQTPLGQFLASTVMIIGYAVIAVPTGIVSAEVALQSLDDRNKANGEKQPTSVLRIERECPVCSAVGHKDSAKYCYACGEELDEVTS